MLQHITKILSVLLLLIPVPASAQAKRDSVPERQIDQYAKFFNDTLQGKPVIDFSAKLLSGESCMLSEQRGKIIVLNFWEIGCVPCMGEISDINKIYRTYKDSGVVVLSLARNSREQLIRFNEGKNSRPTEPIDYPVVPDSKAIMSSYHVTGYPTTILIDKHGIIRLVLTGASAQSLKKYIAFYGDKNLSKEWKKAAKQLKDETPGMSEILGALITDLLKEK